MSDGITDMAREKEATEKQERKPAFEEQLNAAVKQNTDNFYQNILKQADERIKSQEKQIIDLNDQQITFRDEVALQCFIPLTSKVGDYKTGAIEAYRAADAFLRAREGFEAQTIMEVNPTLK